jgi:hypothetical protein
MGYCAWCNERLPFGGNKTAHNAVSLREQALNIARLLDAWIEAAANLDPPSEIPEETRHNIVSFIAEGGAHALAFHEYAHKRTPMQPPWAEAGMWARHASRLEAEIIERTSGGSDAMARPTVSSASNLGGGVAMKCLACHERVRGDMAEEFHRQLEGVTIRIAALTIAGAMADAALTHNLPHEEALTRPSVDRLMASGRVMAGDLHAAVHDPDLGWGPIPNDVKLWSSDADDLARAAFKSAPQVFAGRVGEMPRDWQGTVRAIVEGP